MPKGVYIRTEQTKRNIAAARMGIAPWNKGKGLYGSLVLMVKELISSNGRGWTIGQIFKHLVANGNIENTRSVYFYLVKTLIKARVNGDIDSTCLIEGRGGKNRKFKVGDKVRLNPSYRRLPQWIRQEFRLDIPRTIIAIFPETDGARCRYYLGSNRLSNNNIDNYIFDSRYLNYFTKGQVGRPRTKRRYNRKNGNRGMDIPYGLNKSPIVDLGNPPSISCVNCSCETNPQLSFFTELDRITKVRPMPKSDEVGAR